MARDVPTFREKPLIWLGYLKKDLTQFPDKVVDIGDSLAVAQFGGKYATAKPWKGQGAGVMEIVEDHRGDTFRAVYTVRFKEAVNAVHAFQKKSKSGVGTPERDQAMIASRLKEAHRHYEENYG